VISGTLHDPYTGKLIHFQRGRATSSAVQVDERGTPRSPTQGGGHARSTEPSRLHRPPITLRAQSTDYVSARFLDHLTKPF
jgi:hypothetical protein